MSCYVCRRPGVCVGMWYSEMKRIPWVVFKCKNPACVFEYRDIDGKQAKARPRWMVPKSEPANPPATPDSWPL